MFKCEYRYLHVFSDTIELVAKLVTGSSVTNMRRHSVIGMLGFRGVRTAAAPRSGSASTLHCLEEPQRISWVSTRAPHVERFAVQAFSAESGP